MLTANQALVRRFFDEICNQRKLEVADEIFSADHKYHDPSNPFIVPGPEGMKQLVSTYQRAFTGAHWEIEEMIDAGDQVVTRWTGSGSHQADLMSISPTGKQVQVTGIWIHRFAGDRIVESWNAWDTLGMLQQLGVVAHLQQTQ
jgi:predicted ester cyclase